MRMGRHGAIRMAASALALLAAGCAATPEVAARRAPAVLALPPMKTFAPVPARAPTRANAEIARDFLDLSFRMESGRDLAVLSRFEGPVSIRLAGAAPPHAAEDLAALIARLRAEAGIDLRTAGADEAAAITIEFVTRAQLQRQVPQAACFVVPNVDGWRAFRGARRSSALDWAEVHERHRAAIFVPADTSPQEVRDCLHEELGQALGPLNDLYRLSDSVFNDDNFHTVLTGFDMLVLRAYNDPALASGMDRATVAARLPAILARLNPAGERVPPRPAMRETPRAWTEAIETALGPRASPETRRAAAGRAVGIATATGWADGPPDARMAFSLFVLGRLALSRESALAVGSLARARALYAALPDAGIHAAHIDLQMAAFALASNRPAEALRLIDTALPAVREGQNAALLATLLMLRAEALELRGARAEAAAARLDSLGWARYGFGSEAEVRARLDEIAFLAPHPDRTSAEGS